PPPGAARVLPEGVDPGARVQLPDGVRPPLTELPAASLPGLRPEQGVIHPALRPVDVELLRDYVVVTGQDDRLRLRHQLRSVGRESLEPAELVVELGAGGGVAVRQVEAADPHPADGALDVPALRVLRVPRQPPRRLDGGGAPGKDGDAVP